MQRTVPTFNQHAPFSCDTMVALPGATRNHQTLFAKNSDRPQEESQPLVQRDRRNHPPGALACCQFVQIPQASTTYRHIGSRPHWCWGYEQGANEHQVVIGNEALASKIAVADEPKLLGMELLRLGLERSRSAAEAVEVMTGLISRFGQGRFHNDAGVRTYDNGFLVADPKEAYVIETAGHEWAVKPVESAQGISNVFSIGSDWQRLSPSAESHAQSEGWWQPERGRLDFTQAYCDFEAPGFARGAQRRARSCAVLDREAGDIDAAAMMVLLRDHTVNPADAPAQSIQENGFPATATLCWHYTEETPINTAASLVADLCADGSRLPIYWCSFYSPCLGLFLPIFVEGELPAVLSAGGAEPDRNSPWWMFRRLNEAARQDESGEITDIVRSQWRTLESEFQESAYALAARAKERIDGGHPAEAHALLTQYMAQNVDRMLAALQRMAENVDPMPPRVGTC